MERTELAVVGAGPAGMAAALAAADQGVEVTVIDEQHALGGQIFRRPPATYRAADETAPKGRRLLQAVAEHPRISYCPDTLVWGIFPERVLALAHADGPRQVQASRIVLAPGAYDRPVAFPGWTLPGVMTAGGIQAFLKAQRLLPGKRFLLAGAHPLQLVVAQQLLKVGAEIEAVVFAQSRNVRRAAPHAFKLWGHSDKMREALAAWRALRRARVPVRFGQAIVAAEGEGEVQAAVVAEVDENWRHVRGTEYRVEVDTLAVGYGFLTSTELSRQVGANHRWQPARGGWVCSHDEMMESSVQGIFVAGEITGVAGADVAIAEGRLAGTAVAIQLGRLSERDGALAAGRLRRELERERRFADVVSAVFEPRDGLFEWMGDATTVCRCEGLTAGDLRRVLQEHDHISTTNALKLASRCGMGLCQGRMCEANAQFLVADARGRTASEVGGYTMRAPTKPIPIAHWVRD